MSDPTHYVFGIDPDAFCQPEHFGLHELISLTEGNLIADFPNSSGDVGYEWKRSVAKLAFTRRKNGRITEDQFKRIEGWLTRHLRDFSMLPPQLDPRFAEIAGPWNPDWGWPRNAANSLTDKVAAVVSTQECDLEWKANAKWRRLLSSEALSDCVPELNQDNRGKMVRRDAASLAALVAHPLQFGSGLKVIDPYADYEGWHPTLDAILESAKHKLSIELHCARKLPKKRPDGPSAGSRKAWSDWAEGHRYSKLGRLHVFYWNISDPSVLENHDRYALVSGESLDRSIPFSGIGVGKGWDQAPSAMRRVETSFSRISKKDQENLWNHYSDQSKTLNRERAEDVLWPPNG